jgi:RimJ/RimL family protein N-acetyltransferase
MGSHWSRPAFLSMMIQRWLRRLSQIRGQAARAPWQPVTVERNRPFRQADTSERVVQQTKSQSQALEIGTLVREGALVRLRRHVPANREAFQRWYADPEIARLLRHDQQPLTPEQSRSYFDTLILPLSARGLCFAIHEALTDRLIGTTALTDIQGSVRRSALFRIVIGEKDCWGKGYGTEATRLVMAEAFERQGLDVVRLEVFRHNPRAIAAYRRVGFHETSEHIEWIGPGRQELRVLEMELDRESFLQREHAAAS